MTERQLLEREIIDAAQKWREAINQGKPFPMLFASANAEYQRNRLMIALDALAALTDRAEAG